MARRTPLPPPPPPAELRSWPDQEALLADRAHAMAQLTERQLGGRRLLFFLLLLLAVQLGWGFMGGGLIETFDQTAIFDPLAMVFAVVSAAVGVAVLIPSVWGVVRGLRRDLTCRERLAQWAALNRDPARDARVREPVLSVVWAVLSFALCALGLWVAFAVPNMFVGPTRGGYGTVAYFMGVALVLWAHGLIGLTKAYAHYRLAVRLGS